MESYREKMIRELEVRGSATSTIKAYLRTIIRLVKFCDKGPEEIDLEDIKKYLHHLRHKKATGRKTKMAANSVNRETSAIAFFYHKVLNRNYYGEIPRLKPPRINPIILTRDEINKMINGLNNVFWKAVVMTLYSAGLRQSELRNLKITDVDSKRMVLYIRNAKGSKDRQAILYPKVLDCLRVYWKKYRIERNSAVKSDYLFIPNKNSYNGELKKALSHTAVGYIVRRAAEIAGVKKKFTHTA